MRFTFIDSSNTLTVSLTVPLLLLPSLVVMLVVVVFFWLLLLPSLQHSSRSVRCVPASVGRKSALIRS